MSLALTQCNILAITMRKADLNYQLLEITAKLQKLTASSTAVYEDLLIAEGKDEESEIETSNTSSFFAKYQVLTYNLNSQEKVLENDKLRIETELQELDALEESYNNLLKQDLQDSVLNVK